MLRLRPQLHHIDPLRDRTDSIAAQFYNFLPILSELLTVEKVIMKLVPVAYFRSMR